MLKAADAFHAAGYRVRMISTRTAGWTTAADAAIAASRDWEWRVVSYDRSESPATWLRSGARHKAARAFANLVTSVPPSVATAAFARVHRELVDAILEEPADLVYGGTTGAIAAAAEAGRRSGGAFAVDFEDYHCAEHESPEGDLSNSLGGLVMRWASDGAAFVTAGSAAIARACHDELGIAAIPINNVFPLPASAPDHANRADRQQAFSVYWFSQTIGANRGLEDIVHALGLTARPASLTLRGCAAPGYLERLRATAAAVAPRLDLHVVAPSPPAGMVDACRSFDLGVSAEQGHIRNRLLNLPNKATTYPLAGLPVALTDTPGQRPLADDLGDGALLFSPGDHATLAGKILPLMTDRDRLARAGDASWDAARRRWHWEHALERGALLSAVRSALA
jgi:hypothetical protein